MKHRFTILALVALSSLSLVWAFVASLVAPALPVQATYLPGEHEVPLLQGTSPLTRYVALSGTDSAACAAPESACRTLQYAVDMASEGDTIKVASGVYTEINHRGDLTQVVYLSKTVVLQGGYTTTNWVDADPEANPTTVDARGGGRGMVILGPISPTVAGFRITGGDAAAGGGNPHINDIGGGLYICDASPLIRGNVVFSNVALGGGGLTIEDGNPVLSKNLIMSNVSGYLGGGIYMDESNSLLSDNIIRGNVASFASGGIAVGRGFYILRANIIAANIVTLSTGLGGGAGFYYSNVVLENNIVVSNSASTAGGLDFEVSNAQVINNIIARNKAITGSGALAYMSNVEFTHTTFAQNYHIGLLVGFPQMPDASILTMTNTIFSGETGIAVYEGATAFLEGTLWNNTDQDWWVEEGSTLITGTHNYWGDPNFVDPDAWDYHIGLNSAALNRGVDAGVYSDFEGDMRPMRGGYDLGADELGPAFVVTKHTFPAAVEVGERLTYTIRLTNTGVVSFTPVITDFLPGSVTPGGVLTWTPLLTVPGDVWVQTVPVTVAASHTGPLTNVVRVTTEEGPQRVYTHTLVPELTVTKRAEVSSVEVGERLTYTLSVTNTGDFVLHARITDTLPAHVTPAGPLTWIAELAPGAVWTQQVVVTPEIGYAGPLMNEVDVTTAEGAAGTATATVEVVGTPALALAKWASADEVKAGEVVTYTIAVTNTGNVDLHARITDTLPAHVMPTGVLTWTAELVPGAVWTQQVVVTSEVGYVGPLTNEVEVTTAEGAVGTATTTVEVVGTPTLALAKWASADEVDAGEVVTYTIAVTNTGNVDLHAVITDTLPLHVMPAGPLTWTAVLAPGGVWTREVMVQTDGDYTGTLENLAAVTTDEGLSDEARVLVYVRRTAQIYLPLVVRQ